MSSLTGATSTQLKYVEIGTMIAMVLFGMSTAQVYIYFRGCDRDPRWMKFFVVGIWLLEFVHTFLSGHTVYSSTVLNPNSSRTTVDIERVNELSGLIAVTISSCAQGFFAYRLYIISRSIWLPVVCWTLSAIKLVTFYTVVIRDISGGQRNEVWKTLLVLPGVLSWTSDLLVAAGLLWCIWTRRKERTSKRNVTDIVLLWCLETNVLTCIFSSLSFIFYQLSRGVFPNWIWISLALVTCRSYSMCIFASFIGKRGLEEQRNNHNDRNDLELATRNPNGPPSFLQDIPTVVS